MAALSEQYETLRAGLAAGNQPAVVRAGLALADNAAQGFPTFHAALNFLGYHNQLALANEMMARAWPEVQANAGYSRAAVTAYAARATDHLLYQYLETVATPDADDPRLHTALTSYFPVDGERLSTYLLLLSGQAGRRWRDGDFARTDTAVLSGLLVEFMGYAHRAGVPYARAHLLREQLPRYLLDREAGYLHPRDDIAALLRQGRPLPPAVQGETIAHPLLPDRLTLINYVQKLVQTIEPQLYGAAALLEFWPLWLDFLFVRGLAPPAELEVVRAELAGLSASFAQTWHGVDPLLAARLRAAEDRDAA